MRQVLIAINNLTVVSQQGFESIPSTAEELEKVNQLNQDEQNAT